MAKFADCEKRDWVIDINVAAVKRVRTVLDIDLYSLVGDGIAPLGKLVDDPVALIDVIFVLCQEQAEKDGITDEAFGQAMAGDAIEHATDAFMKALIDFFPNARTREMLTKVMAKAGRVRDLVIDQGTDLVERIDEQAEAKRLIDSSTKSPDPSG